jgi:hypothetical protein
VSAITFFAQQNVSKNEVVGFPSDSHHGVSLFSDQVSAITFFAQGSDYTTPDFLGEVP